MVCYNPISACYSKYEYKKTGKKNIHIVLNEKYDENKHVIKNAAWAVNERNYPHTLYEYIHVPCKKCAGCRSDNAKMWTIRCINEMQMHEKNCFITLTYNDENPLVYDDPLCLISLRYKHWQNFMKRLRKRFPDEKIGYIVK